jgi:adenylate cyclase
MWFDRIARRLYDRLGPRYPRVWPAVQVPSGVIVVCGVIVIFASFYSPTMDELFAILVAGSIFTSIGVAWAISLQWPEFCYLMRWREDPSPTPEQTIEAWEVATTLEMRAYRTVSLRVNAIAALPTIAITVAVLGLPWHAALVLLLVTIPAAGYGTVLNYSTGEQLMRPLIEDIAARLPDEFRFKPAGIGVSTRLLITLPVFTAMTGLIVGTLVADGGGSQTLLVATVASMVVGLILSGELTLMLSAAITKPISELRAALHEVREGNFETRAPITSSDEFGELADDFNKMVRGLAEREQIREAFGTYVDRQVADLLLSGRFPSEGVSVDVSIMFCDVPGFTAFTERAEPREVVAALNELFTRVVPIIGAHGGHVDKFLGDGLLAVFGAPEGYRDHADRAIAAGLEIAESADRADGGLELRVGINSGQVIAGSIGGAGRLNFSVIGDAVNVAARVEAATRQTGDDVLITEATRAALRRPVELEPREPIELKGKSEPCELYAALGLPAAAPATVEARRVGGRARP